MSKKDPDEKVPYQAVLPRSVRAEAIAKAEKHGTHLNAFVVMAIEQFIERPYERSLRLLLNHRKYKHRRK